MKPATTDHVVASPRARGGLLGVVCGEAWHAAWDDGGGAAPALGAVGPVTEALLALIASYVESNRASGVLESEACGPMSLPGWLLATAIGRPTASERAADARELASAVGAPPHSREACVAFVELAAGLLRGRPIPVAVEAATGSRRLPSPAPLPRVSGDPATDALEVGTWALNHPSCGIADVVPAVQSFAGPVVSAAVGGLIGLRDGLTAIPADWRVRAFTLRPYGTAHQAAEEANGDGE